MTGCGGLVVHVDSSLGDEERRARIYDGEVFVFSPRRALLALTEFPRHLIEEAFAPLDPRDAQYELDVEEFVGIITPLKPRFIHHPETKSLLQAILAALDFDLDTTYFDVPRMRVSSAGGYLTSGAGYALHPHRDCWYSQPFCQLNWWLPVFDFDAQSSFEFYRKYFDQPVQNSSSSFNYYEWNATGRKDASKHIAADTRKQPKPLEELDLEVSWRPVVPAGGLVLFSGAQLHATVPNTSSHTRFSVDFRTANVDDLVGRRGAPNVDSSCTGTSVRDLMRGSDRSPRPPAVVEMYDDVVPDGALLVFTPEVGVSS